MENNERDSHLLDKASWYGLLYVCTGLIIFSTFFMTHDGGVARYPLIRFFIIFFATILLTKYFIYMTLSPWYDVLLSYKETIMGRKEKKKELYTPKVSVIVPAWNEGVGIAGTLTSLLESTYRNTEIVVVNDGSTDGSDALIKKFIAVYQAEPSSEIPKLAMVYRYQQNGGKGKALNTGIRLSTGEIVISIDADCVVMPETIASFVRAFEDKNVMAAVGNVKIGNTDTVLGVVQYLEFLFSFYFKKADSLMNTIYIIGGAAGAFRREVFHQIGEYSTDNITEDIHLSVRIQEAGMKIAYVRDAVVYTEGASDLSGLMKQRLRWKRGRFETFHEFGHLFFSTKKVHNKLLTFFVLPLGLFGDLQLSLEIFFLAFLYVYSFLLNDFSSFISGIIIVSSMFFVQIAFDDKKSRRLSFLLLAPIGWLLFYITTLVEYNALIKSLWGMMKKQELRWQHWNRNGLLDPAPRGQEGTAHS